MSSHNEQDLLNRFYLQELQAARVSFDEAALAHLSHPFMLHANPEYLSAPIRVMFVGKETNGWLEGLGKLDVFYKDVRVGVEHCVSRHRWQYERGSWNTPFLRMLTKVANELQLAGRAAVLWINLLKCDWDRGRTDSRVAIGHSDALGGLSARLFRAEVEILQPDFILFACGAGYDHAIKASLPVIEDGDVHQKRTFWTFRRGDTLCIRLRHPGARRSKNFGAPTEYYDRALRGIEAVRKVPVAARRWPLSDHFEWQSRTGSAGDAVSS
jgi:hypothetical protein